MRHGGAYGGEEVGRMHLIGQLLEGERRKAESISFKLITRFSIRSMISQFSHSSEELLGVVFVRLS